MKHGKNSVFFLKWKANIWEKWSSDMRLHFAKLGLQVVQLTVVSDILLIISRMGVNDDTNSNKKLRHDKSC